MRKPHDHWLRDVNHPRIFSLEEYEIGDAFFTKYNEETLIGFGTAVVRKLHLAAKSLFRTAVKVNRFAENRKVTEDFIQQRFKMLLDRMASCQLQHAQVKKVPTYEMVVQRLNGLLALGKLVRELAAKSPNLQLGPDFAQQLVKTARGVLTLVGAEEERQQNTKWHEDEEEEPAPAETKQDDNQLNRYKSEQIQGIKWQPPKLATYDVVQSPWHDPNTVKKIMMLCIQCKFDVANDIAVSTAKIAKDADDFEGQAPDDDAPKEEIKEYRGKLVDIYSSSFILGKLSEQIYNEALLQEINAVCTSYIDRLLTYTSM